MSKNRVFIGRLVVVMVLALGMLVLSACAVGAQGAQGGAGDDNSGDSQNSGKGGPSNLVASPDATDDGTPGADDTPEATETETSKHGGDKVTGTIEAIEGNTITIDGVTVTVNDPALLDGLKVGDTITVEIETENGVVVLKSIEDGPDDHGNDGTPEATDDNGDDATLEPTDDNGTDLTPEATDDNDDDGNEPGDDNGGNSDDQGGDDNGGGNSGGGNGGGSDDGGGHGSALPAMAILA